MFSEAGPHPSVGRRIVSAGIDVRQARDTRVPAPGRAEHAFVFVQKDEALLVPEEAVDNSTARSFGRSAPLASAARPC
jgi:hypothetical protein